MIATSYSVATLAVACCLAAVLPRARARAEHKQLQPKTEWPVIRRELIHLGSSEALTIEAPPEHALGLPGVDFRLKTTVGQNNLKIPKQVLLTGPFKSLSEALRHRGKRGNSLESLGITPDLHVQYFDNPACHTYLERHFPKLVAFFDAEKHGSYRGDICRAAVLAREGGFYVDLDMELRTPLQKLVDDETTFMTARSAYKGALNALIATVPQNPVMLDTLAHIQRWYRNETSQQGLLGPMTMQHALEDTMKLHCPELAPPIRPNWSNVPRAFKCGPSQSVRLFTEELIGSGDCSNWGPTICPEHRAKSSQFFVKFGLFDGPTDGIRQSIRTMEERLIGWPRFEDCAALGCGLSGGITSF